MRTLKRIFFILFCITITLILLFNVYFFRNYSQFKEKSDAAIINQKNLERQIYQLIDDTKEIREDTGLSALLYENDNQITDEAEILEDIYQTDAQGTTLIAQAEEMYQKYRLDGLSQQLSSLIEKEQLEASAKKYGFEIQQKNSSLIIRYQGFIVANITILYNRQNKINGLQYESDVLGKNTINDIASIPKLLDLLNAELQKNLVKSKKISNEITHLFQNEEIVLLLLSNRSRYKFNEDPYFHTWKIYNLTDRNVLTIELSFLDSSLSLSGTKINTKSRSLDQISSYISKRMFATNYKTSEETISQANLKLLLNNIKEKSFAIQMKDLGLAISTIPRFDDDYYYLDIITVRDLQKVGAYGIQKSNGSFWIIDKDDVPISQADVFDREPQDFRQNDTQNILLVGSHNLLADTIIVARISSDTIKLISIPRDLYYQGRKINWYFKRFSAENFNKVIFEITGLEIYQYIYVDMYAFVSAIDSIGGINVNLKSDLIDPSYRIKENGVFTYLNYSKGEHYLNGIEALRIARSRYTTDDFSRSDRQLAILEGIQGKLNSVDKISSFITALKIIDNVLPYISTNLTPLRLAQMLQKYRNATISDKLILSSKNILYASYSNIYENKLPLEARYTLSAEQRGSWILLPRDNDWDSLQKFVELFIMQ